MKRLLSRSGLWTPLLALGLAVGTLAGCDLADEPIDSGGGADTDGEDPTGGPDDGSGLFVRCCYSLTNSNYEGAAGCIPVGHHTAACVDPSDQVLDANLDGQVSGEEFAGFCNERRPEGITVNKPWTMPMTDQPNNGPLFINGPWISAASYGGEFEDGSCVPHFDPTIDYPFDVVPPTHEGTLSSGGGNGSSVEMMLDGVNATTTASGAFAFALSGCKSMGRTERCTLELQRLSVDLDGPLAFSNHSVDTGVLSLQGARQTPVTITCGKTSCEGSFAFGPKSDSELSMLLEWDQTNLATGTLGGGSLLLGEGGLGKMGPIEGKLELTRDKSGGTMRLHGKGADGLGGSYASVEFDVGGSFREGRVE